MKKTIWMTSAIFTMFIIWVIVYQAVNHPIILPSPYQVSLAFVHIFTHEATLVAILMTVIRLFVAIFLSAIIGISLGVLSGFKHQIAAFLKPYVTILRTIPVISIVVILLILFGFDYTPYIITFLMVFPIIYTGVLEGIRQMDSELLDVYHLEEHDWKLGLKLVYFPMIKKYILLSFLQSFGLGIKVLVMAEFLSQTKMSIGNQIYLAKINITYDAVFAWTIILILLSVFIEYGINRYQKQLD
ncbi:MAG: ABC transporter permease subunit [Acholeplasmataceae bacterium]|nr:ABC transporter permease subunit [Acholeplasmataceae bacterium]